MASKQLAALKAAHPTKVSDAYVDGETGSVWVELKPGWTADPRDAHDIVASSIGSALRRFRDVVPCNCADCLRSKPGV